MIEQLKNYLSNNSCDYERDSKQEILLDEDRIQIYFRVDEDCCILITDIELFDKDGNELFDAVSFEDWLIIQNLIQNWVYPSDNTVVIEGRSYEI